VRHTRRPVPADFGTLYHGGSMQGATTVDQRIGGHRYSAMSGTRGYNYATTDFDMAKKYATEAAEGDMRRTGQRSAPSVYEVTPQQTYGSGGKRYRYQWGVDEHSGPSGWNDNHTSMSDALELASYGSEVSLKFESPLKAREVWSEDRAQDVTPDHKSFT